MTGNVQTSTATSDREIISSRILHAPRERVFKAWANPNLLAQWWRPKGFTNTFHQFEFQPGGNWRFVMHGPNGADYQNESIFVEIVEPQRIVLDHISNPAFRVIATFEDFGANTRLTFRQVFNSAEDYRKVKVFAVEANEQNLDRLESVLASNN